MRRSDLAGPADLRAMQQMCSRLWSPESRFHPGQLAWNAAAPADDEVVSIWWDGPDVVGFGWAEGPDWLELQVDPAHPEVADEMVEWFEEWSDAEHQSVHVMDGDASEPALAAAGFEREAGGLHLTHHILDLDELVPPPPVVGHTFRAVTGADEAGARARCHARAWADFGASTVTGESYAALMQTWPYRPDLDWVACTPDGEMVASCLVWLDPSTGVGLVEPVGCVPERRGRGLAAAVTLHALHRLRRLGGRIAQVTTRGDDDLPAPRRLYASLGFRPVASTVIWTRSLS